MSKPTKKYLGVLVAAAAFLASRAAMGCNSPLVLDLSGNGLYTTGVDRGVLFDLNADGAVERCGWTSPYENDAFLWLDLNDNARVDDARELFGDSTATPDGSEVTNGFEALAIYDRREFGGNGDRTISPDDWIWSRLRLWIDRDYNGRSSAAEISSLSAWGIESIKLKYKRDLLYDGNNNILAFWGKFKTTAPDGPRERDIVDIFFLTADP
jgi:hypothetical protein